MKITKEEIKEFVDKLAEHYPTVVLAVSSETQTTVLTRGDIYTQIGLAQTLATELVTKAVNESQEAKTLTPTVKEK